MILNRIGDFYLFFRSRDDAKTVFFGKGIWGAQLQPKKSQRRVPENISVQYDKHSRGEINDDGEITYKIFLSRLCVAFEGIRFRDDDRELVKKFWCWIRL